MLDIAHTHQENPLYWKPIVDDELGASEHQRYPFPIENTPKLFRDAVLEVTEAVQCPMALTVASALSVMSLAISPLIDVRRKSDLLGPSNLFLLTLGDSGERKSTVDKRFIQPVKEFVRELMSVYQSSLSDYQADIKVFNEQEKSLKKAIRDAANNNKDVSILQEEMRELEKKRPKSPICPYVLLDNFTTEGLNKHLSKLPVAMIHSDEAGIVLGGYSTKQDNIMSFLTVLK